MDDSIDATKPGSGGPRRTSAGKSQQKAKGKGKQEDMDHDREARSYFGCRLNEKNKNCSICKLQVERPDLFTASRKTVDFSKSNIKKIGFT